MLHPQHQLLSGIALCIALACGITAMPQRPAVDEGADDAAAYNHARPSPANRSPYKLAVAVAFLERLEDFRARTLLVELQFNARLGRSDLPGSIKSLSRLKHLAVAHEAQAAQHQRAYDASTNAQSEFHRKQLQLAQFLRTSLDDLLAILDTVPVSAGSARLDD